MQYLQFKSTRYIFLLFALLINKSLFAQAILNSSGEVTYDLFVNLKQYKGKLFFNSNNSLFEYKLIEDKQSKINETTSNDNPTDINFNFKIDDTLNHFVFKTSNKIIFTAKDFDKNKIIAIQENLPNFEWKILDEFKNFGNLKCQKATTCFKGIAWYAESIPIYFGPMKFGQLPGLIIEISDDKNKILISATSILYPKETQVKLPKINNTISEDEYIKRRNEYFANHEKEINEKLKRILSKSSRNAQFSEIKIKTTTNKKSAIEIE